jgi:RNA polymerase sigma-70 factor, ECF subfamily
VIQSPYVQMMSETATDRRRELERLFGSEGLKIWRALVAFSGDVDVANEARAEAFAQALAHREEIRSPAAWIWTTSFRVARGLLKERSVRSDPPVGDVSYSIPDPVRDIVDALKTLPTKQRLAIVLHDYADRPTREVAEILGSSRATVHVHLSAARRRLRPLLKEETDP